MYKYKLSVLVTTYNHEKYIAEAIESILNQKVDFIFEIVIADDVSTDRTKEIIENYIKQYPDRNMTILKREKNLGVTKNFQKAIQACQGEYIAVLEGDDYWISRHKLQKQVDFLDQHTECSLCFNGLLFLKEEAQIFQHNEVLDKITYTTHEIITIEHIGRNFSTCMYRHDIVKKLSPKIYDVFTVDWMFNISCSQYGLIGCIPFQMTAYRLHAQGVWTSKKATDVIKEVIRLIPLYDQILDYKYTESFSIVLKHNQKSLAARPAKSYAFVKQFIPPILFEGLKKLLKR